MTDHTLWGFGLGQLSRAPAPTLSSRIDRRDQGLWTSSPAYRRRSAAAGVVSKRMEPVFVEPRARTLAAFGPMARGAGETFATVLRGRAVCHIGEVQKLLDTGDSLSIGPGEPHAFLAADDRPCLILLVSASSGG